jgi:hypothetical protein
MRTGWTLTLRCGSVRSSGSGRNQKVMPIEPFTKADFEQRALPARYAEFNVRPWTEYGLLRGEYVYHVGVGPGTHALIEVRSTVLANGLAGPRTRGIRASLLRLNRRPIGVSVTGWVARGLGWERRTRSLLRKLAWLGTAIKPCPNCRTVVLRLFKCTSRKPDTTRLTNFGRYYLFCVQCGRSTWLAFREPLPEPPAPVYKHDIEPPFTYGGRFLGLHLSPRSRRGICRPAFSRLGIIQA